MPTTVNVEFAGDSDKLAKASKQAEASVEGVGKSATEASTDMATASKSSESLLDRFSKLGNAVSGASDAIDSAGTILSSYSQIQNRSYEKMQAQQRALNDVAQAQEDYNQALRDGKQATIDLDQSAVDLEQANLDAATALKDYNDAVKEHGRNSLEARQATLDLKQAGVDVKQAIEDQAQATRDASQANIDAKGAQLDLNDAQREANPGDVAKWASDLEAYTPLLSALVGVTGLVTAAQWAWNAAQLASPTTWIIAGIGLLVAGIVLIATKTDWFQKAWKASWGWIKDAAENTWNWLKKAGAWIGKLFDDIGNAITAPFRKAFNGIADIWNNTIGKLSWTAPGWIPVIGGNTISVPHIPKFHTGGTVPGAPGTDQMIMAQAGEEVSRGGAGVQRIEFGSDGSDLGDALIDIMAKAVKKRGGNVQNVLGFGHG